MPTNLPDERSERFLRLLSAVEPDISRYIFVLAANHEAAQDIYQETVLDLWRKFDEYEPSRPFVYWACRFAFIQVQRWRRAKGKAAAVQLNDRTIEALSGEYLDARDDLDARRRALATCLEKLPEASRRLLDLRYTKCLTVQEISRKSHGNPRTLYQQMGQIRHWLRDCVHGQMESGDA